MGFQLIVKPNAEWWLVVPCYWYLCTCHINYDKEKASPAIWYQIMDNMICLYCNCFILNIAWGVSFFGVNVPWWSELLKYTILWFKILRWQKYFYIERNSTILAIGMLDKPWNLISTDGLWLIEIKSGYIITGETLTSWSSKDQGRN